MTPIALTIALGFHSIFEGIAAGLINEMSDFVTLAIGIVIHRLVAAISLAITLQ